VWGGQEVDNILHEGVAEVHVLEECFVPHRKRRDILGERRTGGTRGGRVVPVYWRRVMGANVMKVG
jgi:hypothetical protein